MRNTAKQAGACALSFTNLLACSIVLAGLVGLAAKAQPPAVKLENGSTAPVAIDPMTYQKAINHYLDLVKHKILRTWDPPSTQAERISIISFRVHRDGTISDITINKSCGDKTVDDLALSTLAAAAPLEPLPPNTPESVIIDFSFTCKSAEIETADDVTVRQKAVQNNPHDAKAFYEYGRALRFAGQTQESIAPLKHSLELGFAGCEPLVDLSLAYKKLGRMKEAEEVLKRAESLNPHFAPACKTMADLLYDLKRWSEAESYYQRFLQMQPQGPLSEFALIRIQLCERHGSGDEE